MSTRHEFVEKLKSQLDAFEENIADLEERAAGVKESAEAEYREKLAEARELRSEAEETLKALMAAGDEAWEDLKDDADHVWKAFQHSVNYFKSHFK